VRAGVAPVHDLVSIVDRVRVEAPHRAKWGVAAPVRHSDRAGVGRFEGHGLGEEQCEHCKEEDAVGTRGWASDTDAQWRRHGLTSGDEWWRRGSGSAIGRQTSAFLFSSFAQCRAGGEVREEERVSGGGDGRRGDGARVGGDDGGRRIGLGHRLPITLAHDVSWCHQHRVIRWSGSGLSDDMR
jgi:hypothetical protein